VKYKSPMLFCEIDPHYKMKNHRFNFNKNVHDSK
jgi:hypothetical protein